MRRGTCVLLVVVSLAGATAAAGPLPDPIVKSGLAAGVVDWLQLPSSSATPPLARLNFLTHAGDGSGRLFVNDMRGRIYVIANGAVLPTPFLDVAAVFGSNLDTAGSQTGVVMFAFHPDYAQAGAPGAGKFYTSTSMVPSSGTPDFHTPLASVTHHSVLSEWSVDPSNPDRIDPTTRREILRIERPSRDHELTQLGFRPNLAPSDPDYGMLYLASGDGGGYFANLGQEIDPARVAQDLSQVYGKILRIDPLAQPGGARYGVPPDNPDWSAIDPDAQPEVWAYGFRNPHRFAWDTGGSGKLLISDVGQFHIEEINLGVAGANYGWSERQGTFVLDHLDQQASPPLPPDDASFGFSYPVAQYDHDEGVAVVGGFVYRGELAPQLSGRYLFGDLANGRVFYVDEGELVPGSQATIHELTLIHQGQEKSLAQIVGSGRVDLRFGTDAAGEVVLLTKRDGKLRRLTAPVPPQCADGIDNDADGATDFPLDPGCTSLADVSEREQTLACDDGQPNGDLDGRSDFDPLTRADSPGFSAGTGDPGCENPSWSTENPQCQDGVNNDTGQDPGTAPLGHIDFDGGQSIHGVCSGGSCPPGVSDPDLDGVADPDPQCAGAPWKGKEKKGGCGLGFELAAALLPLTRLSWRRRELA